MIDMHSKYDNMHKNGMINALVWINDHIITIINCMLSITILITYSPSFTFLYTSLFFFLFFLSFSSSLLFHIFEDFLCTYIKILKKRIYME